MTWKLKYLCHVKCHDGLKRTVMEGVIDGRRVWLIEGGAALTNTKVDTEDILGIRVKETGGLTR